MSSSDKIVYAPRDESGHANSRKVRSTWPKVIATESYLAQCKNPRLRPRVLTPALDSSRSPSASCDELDARCAFPRFRLSTRKLLLRLCHLHCSLWSVGQNLEQRNVERPIFRILKYRKMSYSIVLILNLFFHFF